MIEKGGTGGQPSGLGCAEKWGGNKQETLGAKDKLRKEEDKKVMERKQKEGANLVLNKGRGVVFFT